MNCSFNSVHSVKAILGEGHLHKVALGRRPFLSDTLLLRIPQRALDLVVVVVQSHNVCTCELDHFSAWSTDAAADIKDTRIFLNAHLQGEVVFVTCNSLAEGLSVGKPTEVEGCSPPILVEIGGKVVVAGQESARRS